MIDLKACERCGGDRYLEEVLGDRDLVCLQCGHRTSAPIVKYPVRLRPVAAQKRAA